MDFELWRTVCVKYVYLLYNSQPEEVVLYATFALLFLATIMLFAGWARKLTGMPHARFWESREISLELLQQQSRICAIQKKLHKELQALDLQHRSQLRLIRGQIHNKNAELLQCIRRRILRAVRKQSHALCHGNADEMPEEASNVNEVVKSDKASDMPGQQSTTSAVPSLHLSGGMMQQPSKDSASSRNSSGLDQSHASDVRRKVRFMETENGTSTKTLSNLIGLPNLGNSCYINSTLQCLFNLTSLCEEFLTQDVFWMNVPSVELTRNFAFLLDMKDSHSIDEKRKLLLAIKKNVSSQDPTFAGNRQNDAHEFLGLLLTQLKEDGHKLRHYFHFPQDTGKDVQQGVYSCPIANNLEFVLQYIFTCKQCGDITVRQEQVNHLSVSVLPGRSLQDSLDLFFKSEDVESTCRRCQSNSTSLQSAFQSLPRVLILHLKRFKYDVHTFQCSKITDRIIISEDLSVVSHCSIPAQSPALQLSFEGMSDNDILETVMDISLWECISGSDKDAHQGSLGRDSVSFSLVAVLSHIGDSSYSGHYLCDAFNEKFQAWVTYDDLSVTITKKPLIQDAWATTTYIAFYLRKEDNQ